MTPPRQGPELSGPVIVLVALTCQEIGASLAVHLFPAVGPIGMVALRMFFAAIILLGVTRPTLRNRGRRSWQLVVTFGVVLAAMNVAFYLALDRLPLGTAVTIELLGPLSLSVVAGRRWTSLLWAAIAAAGATLLSTAAGDLDPLGVLFAVIAAALWAGYILLSKSTGTHFPGVSGVALATGLGAILTVPVAAVTVGASLLSPSILLAGLGIAVLSTALPYALEQTALRRMNAQTFAVLLALAPAVAAAAGFFVLQQALSVGELLGIALVIVAGIGAVRTGIPRPHSIRRESPPAAS